MLKEFLILYLASCSCAAQQTMNIAGLTVTWRNMGTRTAFSVTASVANGVAISDCWIGIGINNVRKMVNSKKKFE
jgi:hypothetical protein